MRIARFRPFAGSARKAGIVLNPGTPVEAVAPLLDMVDLVLLMTVNPGFGGQAFIEERLQQGGSRKGDDRGIAPSRSRWMGGGDAARPRRWSLRAGRQMFLVGGVRRLQGRAASLCRKHHRHPRCRRGGKQAGKQAGTGLTASRWPQSQPPDGPPRQKARGNAVSLWRRWAHRFLFWWSVFFSSFGRGLPFLAGRSELSAHPGKRGEGPSMTARSAVIALVSG